MTPNRLKPNRPAQTHYNLIVNKDKSFFLNTPRKQEVIYKKPSIKLSEYFSANISGQERMGGYIQNMGRKDCQPRSLYQAKLSFRIGEINSFPNKRH